MRPGCRRHQDDAVAQAHGLAHIVGDEHDGLAALAPDPLDVLVELVAGQGVERREGLVHQQHLRIGRERTGERHPLLHAARQLVHMRALELLEPDELEK